VAETMRTEAATLIEAKYTWDAIAASTIAVYEIATRPGEHQEFTEA
jgi:hypothetical protein